MEHSNRNSYVLNTTTIFDMLMGLKAQQTDSVLAKFLMRTLRETEIFYAKIMAHFHCGSTGFLGARVAS